MRLRLSPLASSDLEGIGDYIARDNPRRASGFVAEIREQCNKIASSPLAYRARPELGNGIRSCAFGDYVIVFQAGDTDVLIVRILHGAMDIPGRLGSEEGR